MRTSQEITLRAHHGMCLAFFQGKGYSDTFTAHMAQIKELLEENPGRRVQVAASADVICSACPQLEKGVCRSAAKTARYDHAVLEACGLEEGAQLAWQEFERLVEERILDGGKRRLICGDCQWDSLCVRRG